MDSFFIIGTGWSGTHFAWRNLRGLLTFLSHLKEKKTDDYYGMSHSQVFTIEAFHRARFRSIKNKKSTEITTNIPRPASLQHLFYH